MNSSTTDLFSVDIKRGRDAGVSTYLIGKYLIIICKKILPK